MTDATPKPNSDPTDSPGDAPVLERVLEPAPSLPRGRVKRSPAEERSLMGRRFQFLTVIARAEPVEKNQRAWLCRCDCGKEIIVPRTWSLLGNHKSSCGCKTDAIYRARVKHGASRSAVYKAWQGMITRCLNPKEKSYPRYGGRGIKVCERWRESFEHFIEDMGPRPPGMSVERIDNMLGYEPGNCRWATAFEQAQNRRSNLRITIDGDTACLNEWARRSGVSKSVIRTRMRSGLTGSALLEKSADRGDHCNE